MTVCYRYWYGLTVAWLLMGVIEMITAMTGIISMVAGDGY